MTGILNDQRTERTDKPAYYVVATDKFMSGWGLAPNGSYVAYPIYKDTDYNHKKALIEWMEWRGDWKRIRESSNLPRLKDGQHCSLYDLPSIEEIKRRYHY